MTVGGGGRGPLSVRGCADHHPALRLYRGPRVIQRRQGCDVRRHGGVGRAYRAARLCHPCVLARSSLLFCSAQLRPCPSCAVVAASDGATAAYSLRPHASQGLSAGSLEGTGPADDTSSGKRAGGGSKNRKTTEALSAEEVKRIENVLRVTAAAAVDQFGARSRINSRAEL
jgi:hypothetical protein